MTRPIDCFLGIEFYSLEALEHGMLLGLKRTEEQGPFFGFYRLAYKGETPDAFAAHPDTIQAIKEKTLTDWYLVVAKHDPMVPPEPEEDTRG